MDFAVPADHRVKVKEGKKLDKYLDFARELKKLLNMKVTVIPIVVGDFGMVPKSLEEKLVEQEVRGRIETIQIPVLWRKPRILRRVLETYGNLLSLRLQWKNIS